MRVLFVDDEPQVLRGIERMLDAADVEWDSDFATSGREALSILKEDPFDAIVTDIRMPCMDGAQLLKSVSKRYPHLIRVILSGQADKEMVFRAVNPMHRYLTKPCEAKKLTETISRACALRDVLHSDKLKSLVGGIPSLPSLPTVYRKLMRALDRKATMVEIGDIISEDPAMSAKILQLANSAVFGISQVVSSPARAASLLGAESVKSLALSVGVFNEYEDLKSSVLCYESLMRHSMEVAGFARSICNMEKVGVELANDAFTAGVLHDVGKLILLTQDTSNYERAVEMSNEENISICEAEERVFGADHAAIGAYLLNLWGLPQSIVEIVALHHKPHESSEFKFGLLTAVCAANEISRRQPSDQPMDAELEAYLTIVGCNDRLDAWRERCFQEE